MPEFIPLIAGVVGAGASIFGAEEQASATRDASDAMAAATKYGADIQKEMFEEVLNIQRPYMEAGYGALDKLKTTAFDLESSPLYQLQRQEGTRAIQRAFGSRGKSQSPEAMFAESDFAAKLAAGETDKMYGRLLDLAKIGTGSAGALSGYTFVSSSIYRDSDGKQTQWVV